MLLIFVAVKDSMWDSSRILGRCMPRAQIKELRVLGGRSSRDTVSISKLLFYWIFWEELLRCWSKKVTFVLHCPSLLSHFHHSWRYQKNTACKIPLPNADSYNSWSSCKARAALTGMLEMLRMQMASQQPLRSAWILQLRCQPKQLRSCQLSTRCNMSFHVFPCLSDIRLWLSCRPWCTGQLCASMMRTVSQMETQFRDDSSMQHISMTQPVLRARLWLKLECSNSFWNNATILEPRSPINHFEANHDRLFASTFPLLPCPTVECRLLLYEIQTHANYILSAIRPVGAGQARRIEKASTWKTFRLKKLPRQVYVGMYVWCVWLVYLRMQRSLCPLPQLRLQSVLWILSSILLHFTSEAVSSVSSWTSASHY